MAGTTILPELRKTNAGEPYLLAWLAFGRGILQKIIHPFFLLFKELTPGPRLVNLILAILTSYFWLINFIFPKI